MLARLQQFTTACLLALGLGWLLFWWNSAPWLAASGALLLLLGYTLFLGAEFLALNALNQGDPAGPARWRDLARAWWGEIITAPPVFAWRQPFRSQAEPDLLLPNQRRGVVLVHGFVCNRGLWTPWMRLLRAQQRSFVAVNLEPVFGSIDDYVATVERAVTQITQVTGCAPVLVCHSMGGLAARAWLRRAQDDLRVHHIYTIGTPHHGTWLGQFASVTNGREMRLGSAWLRALRAHEPPARDARFTCWYSNCDNIVFPTSTAALPGAQHRFVTGVAHVSLTFHPQVMQSILAEIAASDPKPNQERNHE